MPTEQSLTPGTVLAAARKALDVSHFRTTQDVGFTGLPSDRTLLAEDAYSFVALVAYDTWSELLAEWENAQAELVLLMSKRLARSSAKAWDGYLVLTCPDREPGTSQRSEIERDTTRVRKFVATGNNLRTIRDVSRLLEPFMPLEISMGVDDVGDVLATLPDRLDKSIDPESIRAVVDAFKEGSGPLERLSESLAR